MKRICIAGLGAAAYAAIVTLKRLGCRDEITVIDPKEYDLLHLCGLPFALEGKADAKKLSQAMNCEQMGVRRIYGTVCGIEAGSHTVEVLSSEGKTTIQYDTLLCATGSKPVVPRIPGVEKYIDKGVFSLSNQNDLIKIEQWIVSKKKCAVIGAGAIGLETASALISLGLDVTVFEAKQSIMPDVLDKDVSCQLADTLSGSGMKIVLPTFIQGIEGGDSIECIIAGGAQYDTDICVLATGRTPQIDYIPDGIEHVDNSGIITDEAMRTSDPDIYAAGDCAITRSVIDGKSIAAKLASSSYNQGVVAAYGILGIEREYRGSTGTFVSMIGDIEISATGFTTETARERGFDPVSVKISSKVTPDYYNDEHSVTVKVIADRKSARIIGGQAIGYGASARMNILSAVIPFNASVYDCEALEMAYCPAVSDVYDPLRRAIDGIQRRMK